MTEHSDLPALTRRQRALIAGILAGRTNKALASQLGIKEQTVRNQLTILFHKVGVSSRLELALKFANTNVDLL